MFTYRFLDLFPVLCTVVGDTARLADSLNPKIGLLGRKYYEIDFDVVLLFGRTEFAAQISWLEHVCYILIVLLSYSDFQCRA
jgi:hypothetical protein